MRARAHLLFALANALHALPASAGIVEDCRRDLESLPAFLLTNDAGGRDAWARRGEQHFEEAMKQARAAVSSVTDSSSCRAALRSYLRTWRSGHLNVIDARPSPAGLGRPAESQPLADRSPRVRFLSPQTALLVFPSFDGALRKAIADLLQEKRRELARHRLWIIDVRGNGGGSDDVFAGILRWIGPQWRVEVQVEYLVTEANVKAATHACEILAPGDRHCEDAMREERRRLESAPAGSWLLQQPAGAVRDVPLEGRQPVRPQRVAILVDGGCASSCEEFLLAARQSFTVKLVGQHTHGVLDVSNMRPHVLPSGDRVLMYAVTRSRRIPGLPVDGIGVMPDVYVPADPGDASGQSLVTRVQRWLEGGRLIGERILER